jgi:hypothetical protein
MGWAGWLAELGGAALVLLTLADVFQTVLYARSGWGVISQKLDRWVWVAFRTLSRPLARRKPATRDVVLSFAGPTLLVVTASLWVAGLILGFGLMLWPQLGSGVKSTLGPAPTDFAAAISMSGGNMTTAGGGDLVPVKRFTRLVVTATSLVGISVITLVVTYFVEIYNALLHRNKLALCVHHATGATGDAADLLAGYGAAGQFDNTRAELSQLAGQLLEQFESHHFYPALVGFRFREPYYGLSRATAILLDAATLIRTAIDDQAHGALTQCGAVTQLWGSGMHLLRGLSHVFLPGGIPETGDPVDPATAECWRQRYRTAAARLRAAGIHTAADESAGANAYVELRRQWDPLVVAFARYMAHSPAEVDPACERPANVD